MYHNGKKSSMAPQLHRLSLQATQLIRAVATLLNFTTQEEQFVKDYFDYKV